MQPLLLSLVLGIPLMFLAIWCLTLSMISLLGGWRTLAGRYASSRPFFGVVHPFQSARLRYARYNGALKLGADRSGLYVAPMKIFRPFHKPLLIPWSEVHTQPLGTDPAGGCRLTFTRFPAIALDLDGRVVEDMARYLEGPAR